MPVWEAPRPDWVTDRMESVLSAGMHWGNQPRFLEGEEYSIECNSCYRRSALAAAGNFPENLGRVGTSLLSGENVVDAAVRRHGGLVLFDPSILVRHIIHATRLTLHWFRHRYFWQGVTNYAAREYRSKLGITVNNEAAIDLPLETDDWDFVDHDQPHNIDKNLHRFEGLGFVLAMTGIIPIGDA